jgi:hypothetical protein
MPKLAQFSFYWQCALLRTLSPFSFAMRYLLWLLTFSLALPACAQRKLSHKTSVNTTAAVPKQVEPVLVYQRTPCYGRCPTYTATIFADGRVEYDGQRFVSLLGKHTLSLPPATVAAMLAEAKRINFSSLANRYAGHTSDLPASIITVHPVGQPLHAVYASEGIPESLQGYITYLNSCLDPLANAEADK